MNTIDLIATLEDRHVQLIADLATDRLHVDAPAGALDDDLRVALRDQKRDVMAVIWRLDNMRHLHSTSPTPIARPGIRGGPNRCLSCADALGWPDAYGRCTPCDYAIELFYRTRPSTGPDEDGI